MPKHAILGDIMCVYMEKRHPQLAPQRHSLHQATRNLMRPVSSVHWVLCGFLAWWMTIWLPMPSIQLTDELFQVFAMTFSHTFIYLIFYIFYCIYMSFCWWYTRCLVRFTVSMLLAFYLVFVSWRVLRMYITGVLYVLDMVAASRAAKVVALWILSRAFFRLFSITHSSLHPRETTHKKKKEQCICEIWNEQQGTNCGTANQKCRNCCDKNDKRVQWKYTHTLYVHKLWMQ